MPAMNTEPTKIGMCPRCGCDNLDSAVGECGYTDDVCDGCRPHVYGSGPDDEQPN